MKWLDCAKLGTAGAEEVEGRLRTEWKGFESMAISQGSGVGLHEGGLAARGEAQNSFGQVYSTVICGY